jgi:hypothetical protein
MVVSLHVHEGEEANIFESSLLKAFVVSIDIEVKPNRSEAQNLLTMFRHARRNRNFSDKGIPIMHNECLVDRRSTFPTQRCSALVQNAGRKKRMTGQLLDRTHGDMRPSRRSKWRQARPDP